jgi:DNA-binding response OmpR family regulator
MRVLIVEDDAALGVFLQKGLKLEGHDVHLATDGQSGLDHALEHAPDLMVLDLSLPCKDGIQVLEDMQGRFACTSVLVLTGRNGVEDRVRCLNLGADDCLLKPFSFSELTARCRALLRRREQIGDPVLRMAGVELNRMERRVVRDGNAVELTAKEYALLEYLLLARGRVCSRSALLREVWQMSPDAGTNVVDVYVNYLRRKLGAARQIGPDSGPDRMIETVRGEGYAICVTSERRPPQRVEVPAVAASLRGILHVSATGTFGLGVRADA